MRDNNFVGKTPVAGLPTQKSFHLDYYSEQEGKTFQGLFVVRRPTIIDQARIEAEKSKILGGRYFDPDNPGMGVPEFAYNIAEAIAYLRVLLVDAPEWWEDGEILDAGVLFEVYSEAQTIDPFRKIERREKDSPRGQDGGDGKNSHQERDDANSDDVLKDLVDEEVQTPYHEPRVGGQLPGRSNR